MIDEADDIRAKLLQIHGASHQTAGTAVSERSVRAARIETPSEEAIRRKAYECWETRGKVHGRDWEDWFEALQALRRPSCPDGAVTQDD